MKSMLTFSLSVLLLSLFSSFAAATERHFAYTYETGTLPQDALEFEIWSTIKTGRDTFYNRLENRLEFEYGVTDNLQAAFYLNTRVTAVQNGTDALTISHNLRGFSSEWKWKLMDPVVDPIGLALYGEIGWQTHEIEFEEKLLIDKVMGNLIIAFNTVFEQEIIWGVLSNDLELVLEFDLGIAYKLTENFSIGLEAWNTNIFEDGNTLGSAIFLGPNFSYSSKTWWTVLTATFQIAGLAGNNTGEFLSYAEHEITGIRWLLGFHI